jgi:NosR/NirI family nitrous oxide reductase transcriptional regulator
MQALRHYFCRQRWLAVSRLTAPLLAFLCPQFFTQFFMLFFTLFFTLAASHTYASQLSHDDIATKFAPPYVLGERDAKLPIYPIFKQLGGTDLLDGYIFESADIAPIPGFSGTPINLLIHINKDGIILSAQVIGHHEPVFLEGLGPLPMNEFVSQYPGKSIRQNIRVLSQNTRGAKKSDSTVDGVTKATASVHIINQTILTSAIAVARAKLEFSSNNGQAAGKIRAEVFKKMDFADLLDAGLVKQQRVSNKAIEKLFAGTEGEGQDEIASKEPNATFVDLYVANLSIPTVGRNLLGEAEYKRLSDFVGKDQLIWVAALSRMQPFGEQYVHGTNPENMVISQGGISQSIRDLSFDSPLALADAPKVWQDQLEEHAQGQFVILRIPDGSGFDPAAPWQFDLRVTRQKGYIYPTIVQRNLSLTVDTPEAYVEANHAETASSGWRAIWQNRWLDNGVLLAALALLSAVLLKQDKTTHYPRAFAAFRYGFLLFTLFGIGFYAQAQLSIVTLAGVVKAVTSFKFADLGFLLWDPPSLILWAFVLISAIVWGRGTFCGWLCPFGALQELVAAPLRLLNKRWQKRLKIGQVKIPARLDQQLRKLKYVVLLGFVLVVSFAPSASESVAEVEPFKTSITLLFVRSWPFVAYAALLLVANVFVYKAFCRYLCPLGAFIAIIGRLRRWDWLKRRIECGSPCQLCRHQCHYGAIESSGKIVYDECFQCMDCVVIYQHPKRCVPIVLANKKPGQPSAPHA